MDSDSSSDDQTSTEYTTESSDDDEKLETAQICGARLHLPQGLCERKDLFQEFFSAHTWNSLSEEHKQHLKSFLPTFPENDEREKNVTLQKLFNGERFRFNSPLNEFHEQLKSGHYRPDIAKMRLMIKKAERKEAKYRYKKHKERLKGEVISSRYKLLSLVRNLPPGVEPKMEKLNSNAPSYVNPTAFRTKRRYFQELASIRSKVDENGFSSDENYPEGPPTPMARKQRRHLNTLKNLTTLKGEKFVVSTLSSKQNGLDLERNITPSHNPFFVTEESYKSLLISHKRRRLENPDDPELNTKGITVTDVINRTQLPYVKKLNPSTNSAKHHLDFRSTPSKKKIKREPHISNTPSPGLMNKSNPFFGHSSNSDFDSDSDSLLDSFSKPQLKNKFKSKKAQTQLPVANKTIKTETKVDDYVSNVANSETKISPDVPNALPKSIVSLTSQYGKITPATLSDLDGIDMMNLPIDLEDSNIDILEFNNKPELMQETHANFLSLIRDIICSTNEHRMDMSTLKERLKSWQENPISPLNDWYCLTDNWVTMLPSAINFLSGNYTEQPDDFVPYMEYKSQMETYQWIGAGRDSDSLLSPICQYWLEHRNDLQPTTKEKDEIDVEISDRSQTPPPPRCPTTWTVRKGKTDPEDMKSFQEQEQRRYENPHKSFTYRCNGYESVVGPVKGIYSNQNPGVTKARGHSLLSADRPNFVTILTLVRDATARLPNGEGTRSDICELLKSSQYMSKEAPDNILQSVVSGALDRMHTQFDPCVKYDTKRKVWIYLHRNRSEEDFERIHQQYQGMNLHKNVKKSVSKSKTPSKSKSKAEKSIKGAAKVNTEIKQAQVEIEKTSLDQKTTIITHQNIPAVDVKVQATNANPSSYKQGTSLLLTNKVNIKNEIPPEKTTSVLQQQLETTVTQPQHLITNIRKSPVKQQQREASPHAQEDKEINEALQAIIQSRSSSPVAKQITNPKTGKSLVKILTPAQGKSLIIPSANAPLLKQIEQRSTPTKQLTQPIQTQTVTQQLLQTIAAQQKHLLLQKQNATIAAGEQKTEQKTQIKVPISMQQHQLLQAVSSQQLQNVKNITLLRNPTQGQTIVQATTAQVQAISSPAGITFTQTNLGATNTAEGRTVVETLRTAPQQITVQEQITQPTLQKRTQPILTQAQQQQILQTLKERVLPLQQTMLSSQAISKQKTVVPLQKQVQAAGTSLLGQPKINAIVSDGITTKNVITTQAPLIAKVLTNAAGQVISVESLLAHQKQHGSLPQGTTLRISGAKSGQPNIIQLSAAGSQNAIPQFAVATQNSIVTLANQPKIVICTPTSTLITSTATVTRPTARTITKTQPATKFPPKLTQQLVNAKLITQNLAGQKIVQPKVVMAQQNQIKMPMGAKSIAISKPVSLSINSSTNTIRMVNAGNLNLTQIAGKPVLLASKGSSMSNLQSQNIILQTQAGTSGAGLVITNASKTLPNAMSHQNSNTNVSLVNQQSAQVILSPQLKVQPSQVVLSSAVKPTTISLGQQQSQSVPQNQIVLGGQTVRLQNAGSANQQRVVLASQNQDGQIITQQFLLPVGFQGGALNIKALQGVKVVPIAQSQQGRGLQGKQVLARVMSPGNVIRVTQSTNVAEVVPNTNTSTAD